MGASAIVSSLVVFFSFVRSRVEGNSTKDHRARDKVEMLTVEHCWLVGHSNQPSASRESLSEKYLAVFQINGAVRKRKEEFART